MRIAVNEQEDSVPTAGVAGVEATTVKRVPTILDRHVAITGMLNVSRFCSRPLKRVAAWMSDQGLAISPGTLGNSVRRFVPLFKPLADAILAHQNEAAVRHGDETGWRIRSLREAGHSSRAWLWTSVSEDAVY